MLFNSYLFIFVFLPITLIGYFLIRKSRFPHFAISWLVLASLVFYGWYNPIYLALIAGSILFNFIIGGNIARSDLVTRRKILLSLGVTGNVLLLGYFKYANFFIESINSAFKSNMSNTIILPIAISFFTLQQVAYLVDSYRGEISRHNFIDYCLFVAFFPKLISGPIVRFREFMPQVRTANNDIPAVATEGIVIGLMIFFLGLFQKTIIADNIGVFATSVFDMTAAGVKVSFVNSWIGALAYTFQLFFDFSGYCDMAIGLGLIFGIRLPLNFYYPYRATSIIDFRRRWHMTFAFFLRDYLYIPLGGNRKGFPRQAVNLFIVMTIAGLWHGAGWTFIIWGALHGFYLIINHGWRKLRKRSGQAMDETASWGSAVSIFITFISITVAWVFFRADDVSSAIGLLSGMAGINGFAFSADINFFQTIAWIMISMAICWLLPNVQEYMANYQPYVNNIPAQLKTYGIRLLKWHPSLLGAAVVGIITVLAILGLSQQSKFLYFQF